MSYINNIYLYIAVGGACGAVARFFLSTWVYNKTQQVFPYGTFLVNLVGCFLLGLFYTIFLEKSVVNPQIRSMITVGFLGAFTTFSTFSLETLNIIKEGNIGISLLYAGLSIFLGILFVWLGTGVANFFNKLGERGEQHDKRHRSGGAT